MLEPDDALSRYLVDSGHFNNTRPLHKAFQPKFEAQYNRSETSVFETTSLRDEEIWDIASREVEPSRKKRVLARAEISVDRAHVDVLYVSEAPPPDRHAVILGWPEGDVNKSARMLLQQQLAARSLLRLRP